MSSAGPVIHLRELATSAVIGTDRAGPGSTPDRLLNDAAVLGARARAGWRPQQISGGVAPCSPDPRPAAGPAATATLMRLLGDPDAGLIAEWAELAGVRGVRVTDSIVPVLLDWWSRQSQRKEVVFAACGKRGEWLASLNPAWRKPVAGSEIPDHADTLWQTARAPERVALLLTIRRHDPARGSAMVQSTWATDGADERRRFVETLAEGCSMTDEPFLEGALDDKSKVVRRAAAGVLATLPGSRLRARMNERARAIVVVEGKRGLLKRGVKVSLSPPQDFDKAWERDGIEEQAASGMGKRAWLMRQILGAADLAVWTAVTGLTPEGVLEAISEDDYFGNALAAMSQAAQSRGEPEWCGAILRHLLGGKKVDPSDIAGLWMNLKPADAEALVLEAADHKRFTPAERWAIAASAGHRWPRGFSERVLALLIRHASRKAEPWGLYEPVDRVSRAICPDLADQFAEAVLAMFPDEPTDSFKKSIDRVRLRADMHKEFST